MWSSLSNWSILYAVTTLACVVALNANRRRVKKLKSRSPHPLPPGPPPLPIVGNIRGINLNAPWLTYAEWSEQYGDLLHLRFFNQDIIIINTEEIARALLEERSSNYSDRPYLVTSELFGVGFNSVFMPYGDRWRLHRRFFHQSFKAESVSRFIPMLQRRTHKLAHRISDSPECIFDHLLEYTSSVIVNAVYDYDPVSQNDPVVDVIGRTLKLLAEVLTPEVASILTAFPIILKLPSWFPGMSIKRNAALSRKWTKDWVETPFRHAMERQRDGSIAPTMIFDATRKMEKGEMPAEWLQGLKDASATAFAAASDTSFSVLTTFLLLMVQHPDAQDRAYAQIEAVVGNGRLPTISDRESLPYIDAIMRETLRWSPALPLSIPHAVMEDDIYNGYHIPKGTTVMSNLWAMSHNESKYPKPFEFIPDRFLNEDGTLKDDDVHNIAFGFGRRICVGRHFANQTVWCAMATILALWKLSVPKDEYGREVPFKPEWLSGITTHPLPFPCHLVPRIPGLDAKKLEDLIHASV